MFPEAFAMGIHLDEFKHMTPAQLELCRSGCRQQQELLDTLIWQWFGHYGVSAVTVAVEHCLAGRKARSRYVKEPLFKKAEKENHELTEAEKKAARERLLTSLQIRKANFDLAKAENGDRDRQLTTED